MALNDEALILEFTRSRADGHERVIEVKLITWGGSAHTRINMG
jgi:hypothetical protein